MLDAVVGATEGGGRGGWAGRVAKIGGLALLGGLAYQLFHTRRTEGERGPDAGPASVMPPETSRFHPVSVTEDDALLFLRTMVAAVTADGRVDKREHELLLKALIESGIDPQASSWLEDELASPADVDEISDAVNDPEKAAQVYAAARLAIDPDTIQERDFLHRLADALDLDPTVRKQIDDMAEKLS
nr:tellurite resistance TerB family protein [Microvirga terricola]